MAAESTSRLPRQLVSERLLLRLPEAADVAALNEAIVSSHAELTRWMPWAREPQTMAETSDFCARAEARWAAEEGLDVLLVRSSDGAIVGAGGYPRLDWEVPKFEIGYWCKSDVTGRGYVTEATWTLAAYAFDVLGAARVELFMDDDNEKSYAVAERLGFRKEGLLRAEARDNQGNLRDTRVYAATALGELTPPQPR